MEFDPKSPLVGRSSVDLERSPLIGKSPLSSPREAVARFVTHYFQAHVCNNSGIQLCGIRKKNCRPHSNTFTITSKRTMNKIMGHGDTSNRRLGGDDNRRLSIENEAASGKLSELTLDVHSENESGPAISQLPAGGRRGSLHGLRTARTPGVSTRSIQTMSHEEMAALASREHELKQQQESSKRVAGKVMTENSTPVATPGGTLRSLRDRLLKRRGDHSLLHVSVEVKVPIHHSHMIGCFYTSSQTVPVVAL